MQITKSLHLFQGKTDIQNGIEEMRSKYPGSIPKEISDAVNKGFSGSAAVGLGFNPKTNDFKAITVIDYRGLFSMLISNDIIEIVNYIENDIPEYNSQVVGVVSLAFYQQLSNAEFRNMIPEPESWKERMNKSKKANVDMYGDGRLMNSEPTTDDRTLTTIYDMECIKAIKKLAPSKEVFKRVSTSILTSQLAMAIVVFDKSETREHVEYMFMTRLGEPTNDPTEAHIIGMFAYQKDVLYNGVMYNSELPDDFKEKFSEEFKAQFNF